MMKHKVDIILVIFTVNLPNLALAFGGGGGGGGGGRVRRTCGTGWGPIRGVLDDGLRWDRGVP